MSSPSLSERPPGPYDKRLPVEVLEVVAKEARRIQLRLDPPAVELKWWIVGVLALRASTLGVWRGARVIELAQWAVDSGLWPGRGANAMRAAVDRELCEGKRWFVRSEQYIMFECVGRWPGVMMKKPGREYVLTEEARGILGKMGYKNFLDVQD